MSRTENDQQYSEPMPEMLPTLASYFWRRVLEYPDRPALHIPVHRRVVGKSPCFQTLSWYDLGVVVNETIIELESTLGACGTSTPPRVLTVLPNSLNWIAIDLAAQTLGVPHVAVDRRESNRRIELLKQRLAPSVVFDEEDRCDSKRHGTSLPPISFLGFQRRQAQADSQSPGQCAQILVTSGTTADPKCVQLSHRNLVSNAWAKLDAAPQFANDRRLNLLPFSHAYARTCELSTWILTGGELCLARSWDDVVQAARVLHPTLINLVPYLADKLATLLETDRNGLGDQLRLVQVGGAGLSDRTWARLNRQGFPPLQGYGLTEASPVVCSNRSGAQRCGTVGPPVANVELRIDADGILWVRGPNVMLGYVDDPEATRQAIKDEWLYTGDLAEFAGDGHIRILGRANEQIVLSTGYQLVPSQMESLIHERLGEANARVFVVGNGFAAPAILIDWSVASEYCEGAADRKEQLGTIASGVEPRIYFGDSLRTRHQCVPLPLAEKPTGISNEGWSKLILATAHWQRELKSIDWSFLPRYARPLWWGFVVGASEGIPDAITRKGTVRRKAIEVALANEIARYYSDAATE